MRVNQKDLIEAIHVAGLETNYVRHYLRDRHVSKNGVEMFLKYTTANGKHDRVTGNILVCVDLVSWIDY